MSATEAHFTFKLPSNFLFVGTSGSGKTHALTTILEGFFKHPKQLLRPRGHASIEIAVPKQLTIFSLYGTDSDDSGHNECMMKLRNLNSANNRIYSILDLYRLTLKPSDHRDDDDDKSSRSSSSSSSSGSGDDTSSDDDNVFKKHKMDFGGR